ncbi:MAG: DNA polymerase/3'-5' exonuclease PolX [Kiritimatiellae bacterium]|nr:DNA polymerase/3'-5' exonuclease PolX [Kiritimatiellia bacterium]
MPVHNADIVAMFEEIADLLDIKGENPFRIRAYRNAARTIQDLGRDLRDMVAQGKDLTELQGIGDDLARKIREVVETGRMQALEKLRREMPPGITDFLRIPGLGPKRVKTLHKVLKIGSLAQLEEAARAGKVRVLDGFGEKTEKNILDSIAAHADTARRFLRAHTISYAEALVAHLADVAGVKKVEVAGSYRRAKETVGDLDILCMADAGDPVMERFVAYDEVQDVLARGETKSSVILRSGIQVDLRVVEEKSFGAALHYFTGSKAHNIAIRKLGQQKGLKVNEYGVFEGEKYLVGKTEDEVYAKVDLPWIPPELREDLGEIEAARKGELPRLVEQKQIRGDLHAHTTTSDGQDSLKAMAEGARARGYEYLAITEHSKRLAMTGGLDEKRLRAQGQEIDKLNEKLEGFRVLKGIEVDILEDGTLDLADDVLSELDLVAASIHSLFNLPREKQTDRILRAMDNRYVTFLSHPSGRLLLERDAYEVDLDRIVKHAAERGCCLELNSHPQRLDLDDTFCRMAKNLGVLIAVNTDAHSVQDLDNIRYGLGQARRGWLEAKDVLNTRPLKKVLELIKRMRG